MLTNTERMALLSKLSTGDGLFRGIPHFLQADGSILDMDGNEVAKASQAGADKYAAFAGFMAANEVPYVLPAATAEDLGGITMGAALEDSVAETAGALVTDFNALLAALRTSGVLATPVPSEE